jgi:small GTP-binding protein
MKLYLDDKTTLNFIDTSGSEKYDSITDNYTSQGDIVLLVYDSTNEKSFERITYWKNSIYYKENVEFILIGTKTDLENKRLIKEDRANALCQKLKINLNFQISSLKRINKDHILTGIKKCIYKSNPKIQENLQQYENKLVEKIQNNQSGNDEIDPPPSIWNLWNCLKSKKNN